MTPADSISAGNALLLLAALAGIGIAWLRPLPAGAVGRGGESPWAPWNFRLTRILFLVWAVVLVLVAANAAGLTLLRAGTVEGAPPSEPLLRWTGVLSTVVLQLGLLGVGLWAVRARGWTLPGFFRESGDSDRSAFRVSLQRFLRLLPLVWLVGVLWGLLLVLLRALGLPLEPEPQRAVLWIAESDSPAFLLSMGVLVVIGAPVVEELIFRGLLFRYLSEKLSLSLALWTSGVLFALLHASLQSFLPLVVLGVLLAKVYRESGDLRVPILFHLFFNLFSFLNLLLLPAPPG
jgi:hypothetical protein